MSTRGVAAVLALIPVLCFLPVTPAAANAPHPAASPQDGLPYPGDPTAEAKLVAGEEQRLLSIGSQIAKGDPHIGPYLMHPDGAYTLVLPARERPYTLPNLQRYIPQQLTRNPDGSWTLSRGLVISPGATLRISDPAGLTLRLTSDVHGFTAIANLGGRLEIAGSESHPVQVRSWDAAASRPDGDTRDGRAYIRSVGGSVGVAHAELSSLGFWSGNTGGLSLTGTRSDASLDQLGQPSGDDAVLQTSLVSADVADATFTNDAYGLFVTAARRLRVTDSAFDDNLVDGLVLHRYVSGAVIQHSSASRNAVDGFRLSRGTSGAVLTDVDALHNHHNGVTIDGSPLADGPNATGIGTTVYGHSSLLNSTVRGNGQDGIEVQGGTDILIRHNRVQENGSGIVVTGSTDRITVSDNTVAHSGQQGIALREGPSAATVAGNRVAGSEIGIYLRDAVAAVKSNTIIGATSHAVAVVGVARGTSVVGNHVGGIGPSAVDVLRSRSVVVRHNSVRGWTTTQTLEAFLRSKFPPLTVLWIVVGILAVVTAGGARRHLRRGVRHPYPDHEPLARIAGGPVDPASLGLVPMVAVRDAGSAS